MNSAKKRRGVTERQLAILDAINDYVREFKTGPTLASIAKKSGLKNKYSVRYALRALEDHGLVCKVGRHYTVGSGISRETEEEERGFLASSVSVADVVVENSFVREHIDINVVIPWGFSRFAVQAGDNKLREALAICEGDYMIFDRELVLKSNDFILVRTDKTRGKLSQCTIINQHLWKLRDLITGKTDYTESKQCEIIGILFGVVRSVIPPWRSSIRIE